MEIHPVLKAHTKEAWMACITQKPITRAFTGSWYFKNNIKRAALQYILYSNLILIQDESQGDYH